MATESSQRAMTFSAGDHMVTWGSIWGVKFPPLKYMAEIVTPVSRRSVDRSIDLSIDQSINQPINQSINQSIDIDFLINV